MYKLPSKKFVIMLSVFPSKLINKVTYFTQGFWSLFVKTYHKAGRELTQTKRVYENDFINPL